MTVFDGNYFAGEKVKALASQVRASSGHVPRPHIGAIVFVEDKGSVLYTGLKSELAQQLGIGYTVQQFSLTDEVEKIAAAIKKYNQDPAITGIIIQKPWRQTWLTATGGDASHYAVWWESLVGQIDPHKDVDGLHPQTLAAIKNNTWQAANKVLPATCQAVLDILWANNLLPKNDDFPSKKTHVIIIGKSDLLGWPLFYLLQNQPHVQVEIIGQKELSLRIEHEKFLLDADVVVTATGRSKLITGNFIKTGAALIDVGEPRPDVDRQSVGEKAAFLTPVPGGVGPMTVACLMENAIKLCYNSLLNS